MLTHAGTRTWTFYVNDVAEGRRRVNAALPHEPPLPIALSSTDDPSWTEYATMLAETGVSGD